MTHRVTNHKMLTVGIMDNHASTVDNAAFAPTTLEFESDTVFTAGALLPATTLNGLWLTFRTGANRGESRRILDQNVAAGREHYIFEIPFTSIPADGDAFITYVVLHAEPFIGKARATGSGAKVINLGTRERFRDQWFEGLKISLIGGTGVGQQRQIVQYDGTVGAGGDKLAYVNSPWLTIPDNTTDYRIEGHLYHPCFEVLIRPKENSEQGNIILLSPQLEGLAFGNERRIVLENYTATDSGLTPGKSNDHYLQRDAGFTGPLFIGIQNQLGATNTADSQVVEVERFE